MDIQQFLTLDCTECAVEGKSKKRTLEIISQIASQQYSQLSQQQVLASLTCREKLGSTGIGNGIALPHGRIEGIQQTLGILLTCVKPIDFDAIDDRPVDIFFAILVPKEQSDGHLQTLASIATKLNDKTVVKAIRAADNKHALYNAING